MQGGHDFCWSPDAQKNIDYILNHCDFLRDIQLRVNENFTSPSCIVPLVHDGSKIYTQLYDIVCQNSIFVRLMEGRFLVIFIQAGQGYILCYVRL